MVVSELSFNIKSLDIDIVCVVLLLGGQPTDTGLIKKVEGDDIIEFQVSS